MSLVASDSPLKQQRQFKMKQAQDLKILRSSQDNSYSSMNDSETPENQGKAFLNQTNTKVNLQPHTPKSSFRNSKINFQSLRGSPNQSFYNSDDQQQQPLSKNQDAIINIQDQFQNSNLNTYSQPNKGLHDQVNKPQQISRDLKRQTSKSLYNDVNNASRRSYLQHLQNDEQKLFLQAFENSKSNQDNKAIISQPLKLNQIKQSQSARKLAPYKQQVDGIIKDNLFVSQDYDKLKDIKGSINQSQQQFSQQFNLPKSASSTPLKNQSILNLAGSILLTPTKSNNKNNNIAQSTIFQSNKQQNSGKDMSKNFTYNTLGQNLNIDKLKMQFYQKLGTSSPQNSQIRIQEGRQIIIDEKNQKDQLALGINQTLKEMLDEKNVFHELISPESPDGLIGKSNKNDNKIIFSFQQNQLNLNGNFGLNNQNQSTLSFSQALQTRIGEMNSQGYDNTESFHSTYKNIYKMQQQADHFNQGTDLQQAILYKAYQSNVLPRKLGLISKSGSENSKTQTIKNGKKYLNLSHLNIGSTYQSIVASALAHVDFSDLYSLNLSKNNLTNASVELILQNLPENITKVDISNNNIGVNGAASLKQAFNSKKYSHLRYLNISNNQLGDNGIKTLTEAIQNNTTIYSLDLSYNKLGDQSCIYLQQILQNNSYIQELYLQWNKISSRGGLCIAEGLALNSNMKVIDLSHNGLGSLSKLQTGIKILQSCSIVESGMRHLDLSYNQYVKSEALQIAEILANNNKLFGFHFMGNQCNAIIDPRGFMFFQTDQDILRRNILDFHMQQRSIQNVNSTGHNRAQSFDCKTVDNCWLCDGWQEIKFEIKPGCSELFTGEPAFLHLDFEDYQPFYMEKDQDDQTKFILYRMCPPGRQISFFFSDPCKNVVYSSKDYNRVDFFIPEGFNTNFFKDDEELITDGTLKKKFTVKYLDGSIISYPTPPKINVITTQQQSPSILSSDYESNIKCIPREKEIFYKINFSDQWHKGISLFRNYIEDSEELEDKCFEEDWNNSKISYIVQTVKGSNVDECKKMLRLAYPQLRITYKMLSVHGMSGDIFCISQNPFSQFVQATEIFDNNYIKIRDIDLNFTTSSSKALKNKTYRAPDKTLVRNEFIEVIVRLAVDKYNKSKIYATAQQAIEAVLTSNPFLEYLMQFENSQIWRDERYWNQQCDAIFKSYLELVKTLWNQYADSRKGEKRYYSSIKTMSIYEFKDFVLQFELVDDFYAEKEIPFTYSLSIMTQIDELNSDRYFQMNFDEFLEALARIAEKKSMIPVGEVESQYDEQERRQLHLRYKLESFLYSVSQKYDKLFSKDKKKQAFNHSQAALDIKGSKNQSSYSSWEEVKNEKKEQLKQKIKSVIKADNIQQQLEQSFDAKEPTDFEIKLENNDQNTQQQNLQNQMNSTSNAQVFNLNKK
ncbi:hypothetical protein TTHERM_00853000 (macronuclear) [Tetrahymena thermophila SB210]|uniref:Leucine Rich Repeat family protein n=1 Tax=Tetrahymena thermophila (strain SB210) TaxID=312017 RepID=Q24E40_TETTS|nr:hypothetical protein TTHERM_00853000 [Tetrahymena thermophila SB210]EAS06061.2 hypothetical protein TTHERM_00853000 [Tetrahymena thermophila SB210]|eukprot:XP_001026306.2 hypothetical protein TTHERM_00853000 [Tetrahymena thermophila SB210]